MKRLLTIALIAAVFAAAPIAGQSDAKPKIGVTLHAYYSWVKNIVGDKADVTPVIPPSSDPHSYQPRPSDLEPLREIVVIVLNGKGHDDFVRPMLKAAGREDIDVIDPQEGLPLIPIHRKTYAFEESGAEEIAYNSHTFIAISGAVQQVYTIARELGNRYPDKAEVFKSNSRAYAKRLRRLLRDAVQKINAAKGPRPQIATVHDGYAYLMQELDLKVAAVIQPRHGIEPNARQLRDTIERINDANVDVLFTELDYAKKYVDIIYEETGCRIYKLSHVSNGEYAADKFERDMQNNLQTIVEAVTGGPD